MVRHMYSKVSKLLWLLPVRLPPQKFPLTTFPLPWLQRPGLPADSPSYNNVQEAEFFQTEHHPQMLYKSVWWK